MISKSYFILFIKPLVYIAHENGTKIKYNIIYKQYIKYDIS